MVLISWPRDPPASASQSTGIISVSHRARPLALFLTVQKLLCARHHHLYITHIRSHSRLPGPLSEGNTRADALVWPQMWFADFCFLQAQADPAFFHQNALSLKQQFHLTLAQAHINIKTCPDCQWHSLSPFFLKFNANPQDFVPNTIWESDIIQYPPIWCFKFLHVTMDTYTVLLHAAPGLEKKLKMQLLICLNLLWLWAFHKL